MKHQHAIVIIQPTGEISATPWESRDDAINKISSITHRYMESLIGKEWWGAGYKDFREENPDILIEFAPDKDENNKPLIAKFQVKNGPQAYLAVLYQDEDWYKIVEF